MTQVDFTLKEFLEATARQTEEIVGRRLEEQIVRLDARIDKLDARLSSRIDRLEAKMDRRFDVVEFRLDRVEDGFDSLKVDLEERSLAVQQDYAAMDQRVTQLKQREV